MPDEQMATVSEPEMDATFAETGEAEVMDEGGERRRRELAQNLEEDDEQEKGGSTAFEHVGDEAAQDAGDGKPEASAAPHMSMRDIVRAAAVVSAKKGSPAAAKASKAEQPTASDKVMAEIDQNMRDMAGVSTPAATASEPAKKSTRTSNNSIDKAYLSGSVSAIGCPCVLPGGGRAIIMMGTPVVCTDGSYAVMGTDGVQPMNLAGADGANNGDYLRNAFMLGFMSGMQGNGFMNGFMRSLGTQLGMAGLSALRGETGAAKHAQASMSLETGELSDLARPKEDDARKNVDLNGDGVANDEQQRANAEANAEANADEDGTEKDETKERREREARVAARRLPNASLMGHVQGASAGLDMGA